MSQEGSVEGQCVAKNRTTRRKAFRQQMHGLVPWPELEARIIPHYAKGSQGRPPYPLSVMLWVHCLQLFYNLSDPALEDARYEVESMRRFAGVKLDRVSDESTILNFWYLRQKHGLGKGLFGVSKAHLASRGLMLRAGTILDAGSSRHLLRPGSRPQPGMPECARRARARTGTSCAARIPLRDPPGP
jgi:hypothetical protein